MSPNSPSMTSMPVALVKGLNACFLNASETEPPQPSKRMDLAAQASLTLLPKGDPTSPMEAPARPRYLRNDAG
jgi:hypothetical protein